MKTKDTNPTKVVYVHFNDPKREQQDYFFGSVVAIYSMFTEKELGIQYRSLLNTIAKSNTYNNPYVRIIIGSIIRNKKNKNVSE